MRKSKNFSINKKRQWIKIQASSSFVGRIKSLFANNNFFINSIWDLDKWGILSKLYKSLIKREIPKSAFFDDFFIVLSSAKPRR